MPLITEQPGWSHDRIDGFREVRNLGNKAKVREALGLLFQGVNDQLLDDYASLAFYLMQPGNISRNDTIEEDAKRCQRQLKAERGRGNASISRLLRTMMSRFGFADVAGVYMVGDAGDAFGRVVRNKMLFVDGISWVHGEFTHTIQWLYLAFAREGRDRLVETHRTIPDLYAESVNHRSPYEFWAEQEILQRPTGKLFTDQELGQIQTRTRGYAHHGTLTGDDVEDLWLSVKIERNP